MPEPRRHNARRSPPLVMPTALPPTRVFAIARLFRRRRHAALYDIGTALCRFAKTGRRRFDLADRGLFLPAFEGRYRRMYTRQRVSADTACRCRDVNFRASFSSWSMMFENFRPTVAGAVVSPPMIQQKKLYAPCRRAHFRLLLTPLPQDELSPGRRLRARVCAD